MKESRYFFVPEVDKGVLPEEESQHALRVLRLAEGDDIYLIDGRGSFYHAVVSMATSKKCCYDVLEVMPQSRLWNSHIHLAMAPTKNIDRVEWMTEKATEIGFDELSFLNCRFSERRVVKCGRIEKIVVSAVKQSRKAWKPVVNEMMDFEEFVRQPRKGVKCIAHCYEEVARTDFYDLLQSPEVLPDEDITIMIGPEGDFSIDEVRMAESHGFISISLGECRLRTETACLFAVAIAQLSRRNCSAGHNVK